MNESDFKEITINNTNIKKLKSINISGSGRDSVDINISNFNITIVGLGLIGGSFAMALNKLKPKNLWAVDINMDTINKAKDMNIISEGYLEPTIPLRKSDIVIICVYPNITLKFIKENISNFKTGSIITDTSGLKSNIVKELEGILRDDIDFIGGHPMAGRELEGIDFATDKIFKGANYILTPTCKNKHENIDTLEKIIRTIGCENIVKINSTFHDEIVAYTSQLPHIMALALVNSNNFNNIEYFIAGSYKDATRVANINTKLWLELFIDNRKNLIDVINVFEDNLSNIKNSLINNDKERLEFLIENKNIRKV